MTQNIKNALDLFATLALEIDVSHTAVLAQYEWDDLQRLLIELANEAAVDDMPLTEGRIREFIV